MTSMLTISIRSRLQVKQEAFPSCEGVGEWTVPAGWICWSAACAGSMASLSHVAESQTIGTSYGWAAPGQPKRVYSLI